jgi:hypothetical protein
VQFAGAKGTTPLGAVYIFGKTAIAGTWPMRRTLKANNAVGGAVRVSGALSFAQNGKTFAVAQISEPSGASGVNGDRNDTSKSFAGAVWLY